MSLQNNYGQYCPLAMSAEFLCNKWTMLLLREFLFGSKSFNNLARGVPRMSRTLLSSRLKELVEIGIITRTEKDSKSQIEYKLTDAGKALEPVVMSMANWGQEWLAIEPSLENIDANLLMWDIRRNTVPLAGLPDPFIVHIFLTDTPENKSNHWLVYEKGAVDLCHIDKGFNVSVAIEVEAVKLTKIWMGWEDFQDAIDNEDIVLRGPKEYTNLTLKWFGQSTVAHISKQPQIARIMK
ncbi:MAG: DNA-binding HxlR family transcriptional regulator [Enterobacterales bacterium]|jgi:DNA-binding HxlR family transcriptional regulator